MKWSHSPFPDFFSSNLPRFSHRLFTEYLLYTKLSCKSWWHLVNVVGLIFFFFFLSSICRPYLLKIWLILFFSWLHGVKQTWSLFTGQFLYLKNKLIILLLFGFLPWPKATDTLSSKYSHDVTISMNSSEAWYLETSFRH